MHPEQGVSWVKPTLGKVVAIRRLSVTDATGLSPGWQNYSEAAARGNRSC
jgi:hypothetical protein